MSSMKYEFEELRFSVEALSELRRAGAARCVSLEALASAAEHAAVQEALREARTVAGISVRGASVDKDVVRGYCSALAANSAITAVDFGRNALDDRALHYVAEALTASKRVAYLNLYKNPLGPHAGPGLRNILVFSPCLRELRLGSCELTTGVASVLADGLRYTESLETLVVSNNAIGDDGATALLTALRNNTSLQVLNMAYCALTAACVATAERTLVQNFCLRELLLDGNDVEPAALVRLVEPLRRNTDFRRLAELSDGDRFRLLVAEEGDAAPNDASLTAEDYEHLRSQYQQLSLQSRLLSRRSSSLHSSASRPSSSPHPPPAPGSRAESPGMPVLGLSPRAKSGSVHSTTPRSRVLSRVSQLERSPTPPGAAPATPGKARTSSMASS